MGCVLEVDDHAPAGRVVVALVQARVLGVLRLGPLDHDGFWLEDWASSGGDGPLTLPFRTG